MTLQYAPTTKTLFLIICSGTKNDQAPGSGLYREENSIVTWLTPEAKKLLILGRNQALNLIRTESNNDQKLIDHPYNAKIQPGKDFGAKESSARYIPALWLYRGRFYSNLGEDGKKDLLSSGHHCLILSGLFGLVTPTEYIQLYECPLEDVPSFLNNWQQDNLLTNVLLDYITKNEISNIVDLSAQHVYRWMFNWDLLHGNPELHVLHAHSQKFVSHEALPDFGIFLKKNLINLSDEQILDITDKREWKTVALTNQVIPPEGWPMEELGRIELLIREGESRTFEYKESLTGRVFDDLDDREHPIVFNDMKYRVMKAIASFLNTEGGDLLIGVKDDKSIKGIDEDLDRIKSKFDREDYYRLILEDMISEYLGKVFADKITSKIIRLRQKPLLLISVKRSKIPAYLLRNKTGEKSRQYVVRQNNSTRSLNKDDEKIWINEHRQNQF